jgi:hypothetical protein
MEHLLYYIFEFNICFLLHLKLMLALKYTIIRIIRIVYNFLVCLASV